MEATSKCSGVGLGWLNEGYESSRPAAMARSMKNLLVGNGAGPEKVTPNFAGLLNWSWQPKSGGGSPLKEQPTRSPARVLPSGRAPLVHGKPVLGDLPIEVPVTDGSLLEPLLQGLRAGRGDIVLRYCFLLRLEAAAV